MRLLIYGLVDELYNMNVDKYDNVLLKEEL